MEKNELVTLSCVSLGTQGEGVANCNGTTVFVPYLLKGERAAVRILKVKGSVAYGKIEELLTPAEERVRPQCPVFTRCGGCQLQHLRYRDQLKFKTGLVRDTLRKIGGIEAPVAPCVRSDKEYGYRNKLQLPVGRAGGKNVVGFYAERTHRVVPIEVCPLHPAWSEKLIAALKGFMEKCGLDGYDEETGTGQIRHIVVRELKKKYIVTLVVTVEELKGIDYFIYLLNSIFKEYTLLLNFNNERTNVVFGEKFKVIKGEGAYDCTESGLTFRAGPQTFVQVNDAVRAKLYEEVLGCIDGGTVIDCYSGGGLLTALLAGKCERAYGIEVVPEANACALELARQNGLEEKMIPVLGKVEEELPRLLKGKESVVLDPPRSGVERCVIQKLLEIKPSRMVLVSCNPATLARDLGLLTGTLKEEGGELVKCGGEGVYAIERIQPFDMFPQTRHVETLVVLRKL